MGVRIALENLKRQRDVIISVVKRLTEGGQTGLLGANVAVTSPQAQELEVLQDPVQALHHPAVVDSAQGRRLRARDVMISAVRGLMVGGVLGHLGASVVATLLPGLEQRLLQEHAQARPPAVAGKTVLEEQQKQRNVMKNAAKRLMVVGLRGQHGVIAIVTDKVGQE